MSAMPTWGMYSLMALLRPGYVTASIPLHYASSHARHILHMRQLDELFAALGRSRFRSSFQLNTHDRHYLHAKGLAVIQDHARDFIAKRLAPALIANDG